MGKHENRNVRYTELSSQDLFNMAEDMHSYLHASSAAQNGINDLAAMRKNGTPASRIAEFREAVQSNAEAAGEHKINWNSATLGKKQTGSFTHSGIHNTLRPKRSSDNSLKQGYSDN